VAAACSKSFNILLHILFPETHEGNAKTVFFFEESNTKTQFI